MAKINNYKLTVRNMKQHRFIDLHNNFREAQTQAGLRKALPSGFQTELCKHTNSVVNQIS